MEYAGFWRRFGAFWVDFIIWLPVLGVTYYWSEQTRMFQAYWYVPGLLLGLWYQVYLVVKYGGTPGKLLLGMRIVMLDASRVTPKAATLRYSVLFTLSALSSLTILLATLQMSDQEYLSLGLLERTGRLIEMASPWYRVLDVSMQIWIWGEFVTMLFNKKRRAVHDYMAGTVVIVHRTEVKSDQPSMA